MPYTDEGFYYDDSPGDYCRESDHERRYDADPGPDEQERAEMKGLEPSDLETLDKMIEDAESQMGDEAWALRRIRKALVR